MYICMYGDYSSTYVRNSGWWWCCSCLVVLLLVWHFQGHFIQTRTRKFPLIIRKNCSLKRVFFTQFFPKQISVENHVLHNFNESLFHRTKVLFPFCHFNHVRSQKCVYWISRDILLWKTLFAKVNSHLLIEGVLSSLNSRADMQFSLH